MTIVTVSYTCCAQPQPPYEQDAHMEPASQIGGPGQQQPQPQFNVLPTGQQYYTRCNIYVVEKKF